MLDPDSYYGGWAYILGGWGAGGAFLSIKCIVYCILSPKP